MTTREIAESVAVQRDAVRNMNQTSEGGNLGWLHPGFTDPDTREPLTLRQWFDRHALTLAVCMEKNL